MPTNIAATNTAPQIMTPYELVGGIEQIRNNRLINQMNQQKLFEANDAVKKRNLLAQLYQQSNGNPAQLRQGLINQGLGDVVPEYDKQQREIEKETRLTQKDALENAIKQTGFVAQKLAPFVGRPYDQQTDMAYQQTIADIEQTMNKEIPGLPRQYNPDEVARVYQQGMSVANQLSNQWREADFSYRQQADEQRNQLAQQRFNSQQQYQDASLKLREQAINKPQWVQTVDPKTGLPVWTQNRAEGMPAYSPTGVSNRQIPAGQAKQVIGVTNLSSAIDEYTKELSKFDLTDLANPDKLAGMGMKYNNMMLQAKEAYNLGVLNGPDFQILSDVITNPVSFKGAITSNKALTSQANELKRIMGGVKASAGKSYTQNEINQPQAQTISEDMPEGWDDSLEAEYQRMYGP